MRVRIQSLCDLGVVNACLRVVDRMRICRVIYSALGNGRGETI